MTPTPDREEYERRLDVSAASGVAELLDPRTALPVAPADPTRLDPPIPITVEIWVKDPRVPKILSHLLRLTGGVSPEGVCDREGEERAEQALCALFDGRHGGLLLTHLDAEGRPTFALAPLPS